MCFFCSKRCSAQLFFCSRNCCLCAVHQSVKELRHAKRQRESGNKKPKTREQTNQTTRPKRTKKHQKHHNQANPLQRVKQVNKRCSAQGPVACTQKSFSKTSNGTFRQSWIPARITFAVQQETAKQTEHKTKTHETRHQAPAWSKAARLTMPNNLHNEAVMKHPPSHRW